MLKDKVLEELEQNKGTAISGQELAEKFQVSRNAVWKCITALKEEGYQIESRRKKGYVLSEQDDILSVPAIRSFLPSAWADTEILVFEELDSTNNEAKRMLASGHSGAAMLLSNRQSSGRGRKGSRFASPEGGLYLSIICPMQLEAAAASRIPEAASNAVLKALLSLTEQQISMRGIGDILLEERKVGGILSEAILDPENGTVTEAVVGVGLNLYVGKKRKTQEDPSCPEINCGKNQLAALILTEFMQNSFSEEI